MNAVFVFSIAFIFIAVSVCVFIAVIVTLVKRMDGTDHLRLLGEQLGVHVTGGEPFFKSIKWLSFIKKPTRVFGDYRGVPIEVWHFTRGSGKNRTTFKEMMRLDIKYSRQLSFWLDVKILLMTVPAIIGQIRR